MARRKVNVSSIIRDLLAEHPDKGPTEIAKLASAKSGKQVGPTHVSSVRARLSAGPTNAKRGRPKGSRNSSTAGSAIATELRQLLSARETIRVCGGVDQAISAVKAVGQLIG